MNMAMLGKRGETLKQMDTAGLPNSFILAVTADHVYALEDKRHGGQLVPGRVVKTWDRSALLVHLPDAQMAAQYQRQYGLPDDRQVFLLWLPFDSREKGFPHKLMVARDAPSQRVIDALPPAPKGQFVYGEVAGATGAPSQLSVAQRLQVLETLRATGVISDGEYTAKRAQIIDGI